MSVKKLLPVHPGEVLNTSPQFWLGLQMQHDLDLEEDSSGARIREEVRARA